jgi:hypothetical protein
LTVSPLSNPIIGLDQCLKLAETIADAGSLAVLRRIS